MISTSPDNRFAIAADLGLDKLLVYRFDPEKGSLTPNRPDFTKIAAGAGPRHFAFHPSGKFAYVVTEMIPSVAAPTYDAAAGVFRELQTIALAPADPSERNSGAEIEVHPNVKFVYARNSGAEIEVHPNVKFVYASVRGQDIISVFAVDREKSTLTPLEQTSTRGKTPRAFDTDPRRSYLFAANQGSGNVVVFRIDPDTGRLTPTSKILQIDAVACVRFARAE